jgi:predicted nucleic acid-binding protein
MAEARVFVDTSVLIRYFAEDDIPRTAAAAALLDGGSTVVISTGVILETLHVLRKDFGFQNPRLADLLTTLLTYAAVELADADQTTLAQAIAATRGVSARHISDAVIAAAAISARCDWIASFDEQFVASQVPVRLI